MKISTAIRLVTDELERATAVAGRRPFASAHEAFAVLQEEVDELWEVVRKGKSGLAREPGIKREATQVAAMAIRMLADLVREGCFYCADEDSECGRHPKQDHAGDFALTYVEWLARRGKQEAPSHEPEWLNQALNEGEGTYKP